MRLRSILVGVLFLAVGTAMTFAQSAVEQGVLVVAVQKDSPAQKAGIVRGDIILAVNATAVNTAEDLVKAVEARKNGDSVSLKLRHGDAEKTANVVLGERGGRPWLGAALFPGRERGLGDDEDLGFRLPMSGAYVTGVVTGSPAEKAGLKQGDVILSVDGAEVNPGHSLSELIGAKKVGDTVTLSVESSDQVPGKTPRDVKVTLEKNPSGSVPYAGIQYTVAPPRFERGQRGRAMMQPGVLVSDVVKDGPAFKAGIRGRDVITKVQGSAVTNPKEIFDAVASRKPGDSLGVTVRHAAEDKDVDVTVVLGANPSDAAKAYMGVTMRSLAEMVVPGQMGPGRMPGQRAPQSDNAPPSI